MKFAKLSSQGLENNMRKELVETNNQVYMCEFSNNFSHEIAIVIYM